MKSPNDTGVRSTVEQHFRAFAADYDDSTEWCADAGLLEPLVAGAEELRVLDLGCGTGLVAGALQQTSGHCYGLDISYAMLLGAKTRIGACVVKGEAEALPLRSSSIDRVVSRQLLHYTRETELLCEAARVLRPSGELRLAQVTSRGESDLSFWTIFKSVVQPLRRRFYSPALLAALVEASGFSIVDQQAHSVRRRYTHTDLFRRSPLPAARQPAFLRWLQRRSLELRELVEPEWNPQGELTVRQSWTILRAVTAD
jgi:DNA gyrase subunit B